MTAIDPNYALHLAETRELRECEWCATDHADPLHCTDCGVPVADGDSYASGTTVCKVCMNELVLRRTTTPDDKIRDALAELLQAQGEHRSQADAYAHAIRIITAHTGICVF